MYDMIYVLVLNIKFHFIWGWHWLGVYISPCSLSLGQDVNLLLQVKILLFQVVNLLKQDMNLLFQYVIL